MQSQEEMEPVVTEQGWILGAFKGPNESVIRWLCP